MECTVVQLYPPATEHDIRHPGNVDTLKLNGCRR